MNRGMENKKEAKINSFMPWLKYYFNLMILHFKKDVIDTEVQSSFAMIEGLKLHGRFM